MGKVHISLQQASCCLLSTDIVFSSLLPRFNVLEMNYGIATSGRKCSGSACEPPPLSQMTQYCSSLVWFFWICVRRSFLLLKCPLETQTLSLGHKVLGYLVIKSLASTLFSLLLVFLFTESSENTVLLHHRLFLLILVFSL